MKFGVREICDVTFKTTAANQKVGNMTFAKAYTPAFFIDTAKTSTMEQATTTVYATGGRGNNRLIAWEGEKTMTFTVEDALISPMGLAVLSGAGLINADENNIRHVHVTVDADVVKGKGEITLADLQAETGLNAVTSFTVCRTTPAYAIGLDGSGAGIAYYENVGLVSGTDESSADAIVTKDMVLNFVIRESNSTAVNENVNGTVKLDFYLIMTSGVTEIEIEPGSFGGYFYIEAQTLFRREDSGQDMAAEIIFPRVKVQSGFTFTMASSGDPSTFTFTMDAFPGYTQFDRTKKVNCAIQIIGTDDAAKEDNTTAHTHPVNDTEGNAVYEIFIDDEMGLVSPSAWSAKANDTVTLTVTVPTDYEVDLSSDQITSLDSDITDDGKEVNFTMPAKDVSIKVTATKQ